MNINDMVSALEAVLFAGGEPVSSARLCEVFEIDDETLSKLLKMLSNKKHFLLGFPSYKIVSPAPTMFFSSSVMP